MRRRKTKYRYQFDSFIINNRWREPFYTRSSDWVIFGLGKRFFSTTEFEYYFNMFGLSFRFWIIRTIIKK